MYNPNECLYSSIDSEVETICQCSEVHLYLDTPILLPSARLNLVSCEYSLMGIAINFIPNYQGS